MTAINQCALYSAMLCIFVTLTASMRTAQIPRLCKQVEVCQHYWEIMCRSRAGKWSLSCGKHKETCQHYWRRTCATSSIPFCGINRLHCVCRCVQATAL
uniref:Uncharacterized protein n=1 Tax=Rhipicephalus appendiculatus TaxID=34631 RepID=A0A131YG47_RHIAP